MARIKERNIEKVENIVKWNRSKETVPVRCLNKYNYLSENLVEYIDKVLKIYNVAIVDEINDEFSCFEEMQSVYYPKSDKFKLDNKYMSTR